MKVFVFAAMMAVAVTSSAWAADLGPLEPYQGRLSDGSSALVYFTPTEQGLRVVTTWQSDDTDRKRDLRLIVTLAQGQSATVSVPGVLEQPSPSLVLQRIGDRLRVTARP